MAICLLSPFLIVTAYYFLVRKIEADLEWPSVFLWFVSSLIPIYAMNYVKKSYLRIVLGVLILPGYMILLLLWLFVLAFWVTGDSF